jgi:hypothetical protein
MNEKWIFGFPPEPGMYWFYGYRYGKISCGSPCEPELILMKAFEISNGIMYTGDGQVIHASEVESPHFCKAELPDLPEIE